MSGFGDEEYYALYGTPEQYQRYRRDLERATKEGSPGSPQHEEYYVYRRFRWCWISQALALPPFDLSGVTKSLMTIIMGPAMGGRWKGEEAQREE